LPGSTSYTTLYSIKPSYTYVQQEDLNFSTGFTSQSHIKALSCNLIRANDM